MGGGVSEPKTAGMGQSKASFWGRRSAARAVAALSVLGASALSFIAGSAPASAAGNCAPQFISTSPDTGLDNLFQNYGNSGTGTSWTGGDGTESVALPDGRELWLFDDSLLGKVTNGQRNRRAAPYIHNSLVIESGGTLTATLYNNSRRRPTAYVNPTPKHAFTFGFFPGVSIVNGNSLQVLMTEVKFKRVAHGLFNFVQLHNDVGIFSLPSLSLVVVGQLPASNIDWTDGILTDSGYTYVYGTGSSNVYAARVSGTDLTAPWSYYDGSGWSPNVASAAPVANHVQPYTHMSVSRVSGGFGSGYALISMPSLTSRQVISSFACTPIGPFGSQQVIYTTPEPSHYPAGDGVITYGAHAHPELSSSSGQLVISYDVDPIGAKGLATPDASIYRPRFIDVTMN